MVGLSRAREEEPEERTDEKGCICTREARNINCSEHGG